MDNREIVVLFPAEKKSFFFLNAQTGSAGSIPGVGSTRDVTLTVYLLLTPT